MARLDDTRDRIDAGLIETGKMTTGSRYVDLHLDAVGTLGRGDFLGRAGVEAGWRVNKRTSLYVEGNVLTNRTWEAGAGVRWNW